MRLAGLLLALSVAAVALAGRAAPAPTFHGQVDRILRKHCDTCHHAGDIGPMALDDAQTAHDWADGIVQEIDAGRMPPWRPTRGIGKFVGERGLTPKEVDVLRRWRDAGAPIGEPPRKQKPLVYPEGWVLGEPDGVLDYGEAFTVPAGGGDVYRCLPVKNPFGRDVWISGIDVQPGNRSVLHHVVMYLDPLGESAAKDAAEPGPGYTCFGGPATSQPLVLGGWAPGNRPAFSPRGTAMLLAKDDWVVVQCHYHSGDEEVTDRTVIGLHESPDPSPTPIYLLPVLNDTFTIPAGDAAHVVETTFDPSELTGGLVTLSGEVLAVLPHMHLLGRSIEVDLLLPDGTEQRLVEIPDWDFDWQDTYTFADPVPVPAGTRVRLRSVYDNSAANPKNPNSPPVAVSWGERTVDEMCLAFLAVTLGPATATAPPAVTRVARDARGRLLVTAKNLGRGGRIEIDGVPLEDSLSTGAGRLRSATDWFPFATFVDPFNGEPPPTPPAEIRVRRADGRLSPPFTFTLRF